MEAAAQAYIDKIDAMGGSVKAIEQDYIQQEIAAAAYQYQNDIESGERCWLVLINLPSRKRLPKMFLGLMMLSAKQMDKLIRLKAERNNDEVKKALQNLAAAAKGKETLCLTF
jgi:methylmalonyl-CoA mutase N-terminal domain/subunit